MQLDLKTLPKKDGLSMPHEESRPASAASSADRRLLEWEPIAEVRSVADLFGTHRGAPVSHYLRQGDGTIAIKGAGGGVSRRSAPARAGDVFRATTTVVTVGEGETAPAHFGPMFFNARDEVIANPAPAKIKTFGEVQQLDVQAVAPEGAVMVRLRMVGTWVKGRDTSGILCTYGPAVLYRAKT